MTLPVRNNRVQLPQGHVFWREIGQGSALVFLHGAWNTGEQWIDIIQALGQEYQCVAPDLIGFGESERRKKHYSIQLEVDCLEDYLKLLRIKQCVLVGYGLGAWVAATYALTHPNAVSGLVLAAPEGIATDKLQGRWRGWSLLSSPIPLVGWFLRLRAGVATLLGGGRSPQATIRLRRMLRQSPAACQLLFKRRRSELHSEYLQDRVFELRHPTLILQSADDSPDVIAIAQAYAQAPNATVDVVPSIYPAKPWMLSKQDAITAANQIDQAIAPIIKTFVEQACRR
ncbi:MAG: alpha/beta hydrolase [Cyanobacteria bacterium P01_E01_bin.6]